MKSQLSSAVVLLTSLCILRLGYTSSAPDASRFLLVCPCMGSLGAQLSQTASLLVRAKSMNRTLVLPSFVNPFQLQGPITKFEEKLDVSAMQLPSTGNSAGLSSMVGPVIGLAEFLATPVWKEEDYGIMCIHGEPECVSTQIRTSDNTPLRRFWSQPGLGELSLTSKELPPGAAFDSAYLHRADTPRVATATNSNFPMLGAPYPIGREDWRVFQHFRWTAAMQKEIKNALMTLGDGEIDSPHSVIAAHLRNDGAHRWGCEDWQTQSTSTTPISAEFYASPQCVLDRDFSDPKRARRPVTVQHCSADIDQVVEDLVRAIEFWKKEHKSWATRSRGGEFPPLPTALVLTTESGHVVDEIRIKLHRHTKFKKKYKDSIPIFKGAGSGSFSSGDPWLDMGTLTEAGLMVGNCVSVFSYIPALIRKNQGRATVYFGGEKELVLQRPFLDEDETRPVREKYEL